MFFPNLKISSFENTYNYFQLTAENKDKSVVLLYGTIEDIETFINRISRFLNLIIFKDQESKINLENSLEEVKNTIEASKRSNDIYKEFQIENDLNLSLEESNSLFE